MYDEERKYRVLDEAIDAACRKRLWETASGLQAVDGLRVSEHAQAEAERYIAGDRDSAQLADSLESHYGSEVSAQAEADIVAARITGLLEDAQQTMFRMEPATLRRIHGELFEGRLENVNWVGRWRTENIGKPEPVLGGRSVQYANWREIPKLLEFDFGEEALWRYRDIESEEDIDHFADFIAGIWEIHPFREGNTRTVATFAQLYLAQFGVAPGNEYYRDDGRWFRDALVVASYSSIPEGIEPDRRYIRMFFENVVGADHDLGSIDLNRRGMRVNDTPYREVPAGSKRTNRTR